MLSTLFSRLVICLQDIAALNRVHLPLPDIPAYPPPRNIF